MTGSLSGLVTMPLRSMNVLISSSCCWAAAASVAGGRMFVLRLSPRRDRIPTVQLAGACSKLLLRRVEFAKRNCKQAIGIQRDPLVELELLFEHLAAEPK